MRDAFVLILDVAGLFGCWGLISYFDASKLFWAFRALRVVFWSFFIGFAFFLVGDFMEASGLEWMKFLFGEVFRPPIYRSMIVAGLWAGNVMLRMKYSRRI